MGHAAQVWKCSWLDQSDTINKAKLQRKNDMIARNNTYAHKEKKIPAWVLGLFCFVFKISALTIINILRRAKTDSVLQAHCQRWVKPHTMEHWMFGILQAHRVTQHFWPVKLLLVTLWSNS